MQSSEKWSSISGVGRAMGGQHTLRIVGGFAIGEGREKGGGGGRDLLSEPGVWEAYNCCGDHGGVQLQTSLHLRRMHRLTARPDGVLAPPQQPQLPIVTEVP